METCKVLGFGHVGVQVQDLERSRRFYGELLGFEVVWEYAHTDYHMLFMGKNGCVVELMEGEGKLPDGALNHLSILVDDVEKGKAELEARGVSFETDILWIRICTRAGKSLPCSGGRTTSGSSWNRFCNSWNAGIYIRRSILYEGA